MSPFDVKLNVYIDLNKEIKYQDPKFKFGDTVRRSKYKNIFAEGYIPNWSEENFVIKRIKNTIPWTYVISDLKGEEIVRIFYEKKLQKTNQKGLRVEKVVKTKGDELYVKWKGYDSFLTVGLIKKTYHKWVNIFQNQIFRKSKIWIRSV